MIETKQFLGKTLEEAQIAASEWVAQTGIELTLVSANGPVGWAVWVYFRKPDPA
jgi:hypothetical protein